MGGLAQRNPPFNARAPAELSAVVIPGQPARAEPGLSRVRVWCLTGEQSASVRTINVTPCRDGTARMGLYSITERELSPPSSPRTQGPIPRDVCCWKESRPALVPRTPACGYGSLRSQGRQRVCGPNGSISRRAWRCAQTLVRTQGRRQHLRSLAMTVERAVHPRHAQIARRAHFLLRCRANQNHAPARPAPI
jgi:hypothetical protein